MRWHAADRAWLLIGLVMRDMEVAKRCERKSEYETARSFGNFFDRLVEDFSGRSLAPAPVKYGHHQWEAKSR